MTTLIAPKNGPSMLVEELFNDFPVDFGTDFAELRRAMNRMFASAAVASVPGFPADLYEKDGKYVFELAAPGFTKDDLEITVKGNTLTVTAQRKSEQKTDEANYHYHEISRGRMYRSFTLPTQFDEKSIDAEFKNGVLKIALTPVQIPAPKKVEIKA